MNKLKKSKKTVKKYVKKIVPVEPLKAVYDIDRKLIYFTYNVNDDIILMRDVDSQVYGKETLFLIKGLSKFIFEEIDGKKSVQKIIRIVADKEKVGTENLSRFEKDTLKFFGKLENEKILLKKHK